ncbi:MAG: HNH endonuclease [Dehalococcoidia bacterium]|nr:HNH endonuclease [Dehalococcoidia bacterium]
MTVSRNALVLNQNYEPLNVCSWRRAFLLVYRDKAEMLADSGAGVRTVDRQFTLPSVIRLHQFVRRPQPRVRLTRCEIFIRDQHRCQYCGRNDVTLTLDHVLPRHRGGGHGWDNVVAACQRCNHRKAGRTPSEAAMSLLSEPVQPAANAAAMFGHHLERHREWRPFLLGWLDPASRARLSADTAS